MSEELSYSPLGKVNTRMATEVDKVYKNIAQAVTFNYPRFHEMEGFKIVKGKDKKIALVGGGPSVSLHIEDIRSFDGPVIACGSSHDWLLQNGIRIDYCVVCDPDPVVNNYLSRHHSGITYLVATQCDQSTFELLKNEKIFMWHCSNDDHEQMSKIEPNYQAVGGGCTVGLRSISLSMMLGYNNIHFFGFDSCLGDNNKHHAYDFTDDSETLGQIFTVKLDPNSNKEYVCAGYHLAQAQHFRDFYEAYNEYFFPTFHGEGLLPDMINTVHEKADKLREIENAGN